MQTYGQRLLQAVGDTVLSMVSLIIGAVVNIILDPIMIFGLLGCPAMGIRGAAIATVIGQLIGAAAALWFNRVKKPVIHVRLKGYRFLWQDVTDIYRVGLPTFPAGSLSPSWATWWRTPLKQSGPSRSNRWGCSSGKTPTV